MRGDGVAAEKGELLVSYESRLAIGAVWSCFCPFSLVTIIIETGKRKLRCK